MAGSIVNIVIPSSAMQTQNYLQITSIITNSPSYTINPGYSGGFVKSPMVRVSLQATDSLLATVGDRTLSNPISVSNLTDPIIIEIPYSGSIGTKNTLSWGFTTSSGDTISFIGVITTINPSSCICTTNHLTDFIIEEHIDPNKNIIDPDITVATTIFLNAYLSFAFWISLFILAILIPLMVFVYKRDKKQIGIYTMIEMKFDKVHIYNIVFSNLFIKGEVVDELGNKRPPDIATENRPVTGLMNITGFKTSYSEYNAERLKIAKSHKDEFDNVGQIYDEPANRNSEHEEEFKRAVDVLDPKASLNLADLNKENPESNIFDEKAPTFDISINANVEQKIPEDQQEEIKRNLKKRKAKKRRYVDKTAEPEEKQNVEESQLKFEEGTPNEEQPHIEKSELEQQEKIISPPKEFEQRVQKKEFKFDELDDYEGGEGDNEDHIKPYDGIEDIGNDYYPNANYGDDTIKPKKRKLKKKAKKINRQKEDYNSTSKELNTNNFLSMNRGDFNETVKTKVTDFDEKLKEDDNEMTVNYENNNTHENDEEKAEENSGVKLREKHEYSLKYLIHSLKHGHRVTNLYFSYDYRMPRTWRLCILYIEFFFMIFISGIYFISDGSAADVNGQNGYNSLYDAILNVILDRVIHILMIALLLKFKPYGDGYESNSQSQGINL